MAAKNTVLIVGNGGREHALGWSFSQDPRIEKIWFAPGNAGTAELGENLKIAATDVEGITGWAAKEKPGLGGGGARQGGGKRIDGGIDDFGRWAGDGRLFVNVWRESERRLKVFFSEGDGLGKRKAAWH